MAKKNTDTVPAMLTPGEFVIKKKSAKKIGYDKLNQMNKTGKIVSKSKKSKGKKMAKKKKNYQFGGVVKPPIKAAGVPGSPMGGASSGNTMEGGGMYIRDMGEQSGGGIDEGSGIHTWGDEQRTGDMGGMLGYKKGGKVKATGGYKVVGQRKGYKVGE
jgi:hypothetical protein|tara:strand:+ start:1385 stop:1858 length:474 start_codon:yes stop_codon:yes gene_type:complete